MKCVFTIAHSQKKVIQNFRSAAILSVEPTKKLPIYGNFEIKGLGLHSIESKRVLVSESCIAQQHPYPDEFLNPVRQTDELLRSLGSCYHQTDRQPVCVAVRQLA